VDGRFLTYFLSSPPAVSWLLRNAGGAAIRNISSRILAKMPVAVPPPSVQREVSELLGALDAQIADEEHIVGRTRAFSDQLLKTLLTGTRTPDG
jgi:restriction endonuclease S subunit